MVCVRDKGERDFSDSIDPNMGLAMANTYQRRREISKLIKCLAFYFTLWPKVELAES